MEDSIPGITGQSNSISRTTPLVVGNEVIVGDNNKIANTHNEAHVIAVNASTGALLWMTQVDSHPSAIITGSPSANNGIIYVPVSTNEESLAATPGYPCCTFRGSVVALNATSGKVLWQTLTGAPNGGVPGGFAGSAIWGPLAIDTARNQLYAGTGDNSSVPAGTEQCESANEASGNTAVCTNPDDHVDSVIALSLTTGNVNWATKVLGYDVWTVDCIIPTAPCPSPAGPDFDFTGGGPNLVGNIVGIGQKSGVYWALNPDNGNILCNTAVGPGSVLGGTMWGTASDGINFYVPISNFNQTSYRLANNGPTITWGSWAALDVKTGKFVWQIADPTRGALDLGGSSVANGVVYVGSMSGNMYALNASTGTILWSFASGGSVLDAPAIVSGTVYWGSGYSNLSSFTHGTGNNKLFAFSLGGK